jgi:chromate transporter
MDAVSTRMNSPPSSAAATPPPAVSRAEALRYWFRLGCISFGGPAGQIALMHAELVEQKRWISEKRFLHALNYCMVLPGPEAQQLATYIGWLLHRTAGGIAAGVLFVAPSLLLLILLSWIYLRFGDVPAVAAVLYGVKPAVVAIVLAAAWRIGGRVLKHPLLWAISAAAFIAMAVFDLPFPLIVLAAAAAGWLGSRLAPQAFGGVAHGAGSARAVRAPALIDDDTPTPPHARWSPARAWRVAVVCVALWGAALALLAAAFGWQGTLTQMGWFFTKAALLTFGGAYAVLPYVFDGAVQHYGWLTTAQMMDGLALGETTPGPLIMVVAFVGFVGGWGQAVLGPDALLAGGVLAACVVTFFTFLPSFLFILLGAPFIETTHGQLRFAAPLAGITAAVVGVIVNLAVFFAAHVLWPAGRESGFDAIALAIAVAALVALVRFKLNVLWVIAGAAVVGLVARLVF